MFERPACVDCHRVAPQTNTEHTLLSASFGWRLARVKAPDGSNSIVWRCPACWRQHKAGSKSETGS
jgi:hypothetical protein